MLQTGGGNNSSAALLKEVFAHERKADEHFRKMLKANSGKPPHLNTTGILPIITANTDIASLRRSTPRGGSHSPRGSSRGGSSSSQRSAARPSAFELPHHGIGFSLDRGALQFTASIPPAGAIAPAQRLDFTGKAAAPESPRMAAAVASGALPSHGRLPPFGRKCITSEFYDDVSGGGIACLCPQGFTLGGK